MNAPATPPTPSQRWQHFARSAVQAFHVYASWLVSLSWKRFIVYAVLLLIGVNIVSELPPFTLRTTERIELPEMPELPEVPEMPKVSKAPPAAPAPAQRSSSTGKTRPQVHYELQIDERGIRIAPVRPGSAAASAPASAASAASVEDLPSIDIRLPKSSSQDVRDAAEEAARALTDAQSEAREALEEAKRDAENAIAEAKKAREQARREIKEARRQATREHTVHLGDFLNNLAVLWVLASVVIKITYKGRMQAEVKAAQATETAEAESLKRQVVEARMAAMQAQVEPHFLFNTLASIDHLIETDPPRASQMQRNLIALLRASMPTMREANANGVRDLGREMAVIKPYLEILKVRMEERLQIRIEVPEGLLSAEFPPMMIQSLVENAIKHGLEPKAEGGSLSVKAEVVHGKLQVTVADTGLGFGRAATAGTGVGLANIRERLALLYGKAASLSVTENQPSGTVVAITVPYRSTSANETTGERA
ncbi:histidine kinase [Pelomonas sp. CA6]|uniref:histidine kinase n=1 Tax=Pelomonas sp. CA6 TaxID=2907999 RepID=UPI001F4C3241|nr:histidine kinase [Pelomonas sp. CA6]MCH7345667.1 histidine kinase [Pelomonas sp. CA6]